MLVTKPYYHTTVAENQTGKPSFFVPTVYEKETPQILRWEYHVLAIDPREAALPDAEQLNALGQDGWILVEVLDERATGRGSLVYYYFTRQAHA
jgi:hypothetical protein